MLDSLKITRRQSEIRQELATLVGKDTPTDDETRAMSDLDAEYRTNETRFRAALISEDQERKEAGEDLNTRSDQEWAKTLAGFEIRQAALNLDEGKALDGKTAEIVSELRSKGGYRGIPVPLEALEIRAGETLAGGTPDPIRTAPTIERLFANTVGVRMGGTMVNVGTGGMEYPVATSAVTAGWAATETGDVPGTTAYTTLDRPLSPDNTLGVQMKITRKALKQSGEGLETAIRRDMTGAISEALDIATFRGSGSAGEPTGILTGASGWGIAETAVDAKAEWALFRSEMVEFINSNAANGPSDVRVLIRPEVWDTLDGILVGDGGTRFEWDRLVEAVQSVVISNNALAAPTGDPAETTAILTTNAGGVAPYFVGMWGAVDLIRDPYSDAQSGGLRLTALTTADITVSRASQTRVMTGLRA